jgi:hypothetical protein
MIVEAMIPATLPKLTTISGIAINIQPSIRMNARIAKDNITDKPLYARTISTIATTTKATTAPTTQATTAQTAPPATEPPVVPTETEAVVQETEQAVEETMAQ